jgi:LDH2 family malate/lactate/ureidoglycolate dehydrogenase
MDIGNTPRFAEDLVRERVEARLAEAGASEASRAAAIKAMIHASLVGVDSHGVRLTGHYCKMLGGGRLNKDPQLKVESRGAGSAMVHGNDGLGHYAAYKAVEVGIELARQAGVGAVGIKHSSHLGAAGAYALAGAEQGFVTFATTNTDSMVALHRSLDKELPEGVAATSDGQPTTDPHAADMLLPLGGVDYGYKGAALAGVATLFSALLTGTTLDPDFIPMYGGDDISTPRNMGHFLLVIDPDKFAGRAVFAAAIGSYLESLRRSRVRTGGRVMAPGDREWEEMDRRKAEGIPVDPDTVKFLRL